MPQLVYYMLRKRWYRTSSGQTAAGTSTGVVVPEGGWCLGAVAVEVVVVPEGARCWHLELVVNHRLESGHTSSVVLRPEQIVRPVTGPHSISHNATGCPSLHISQCYWLALTLKLPLSNPLSGSLSA